jgi:beta-glucosidase
LLAAIHKTVARTTEVIYSPDGKNLSGADTVLVVLGEMPYAEGKGDRGDLQLAAADAALVEAVRAAGAPVVTVLISGRPLVLGPALEHSDAFVVAWLPGTEGQGVADVLFGNAKPTGKLPRQWPADDSHLNSLGKGASLFPFGFGMTYDNGVATALKR